MMEIKFQYYNGNIRDCKPVGWITLPRFIEAIRNPKPQTRAILDRIAEHEVNGNVTAKGKEKQKLHKFTPCAHIRDWRNYENIVRFTGLMVLDFDHIKHAPELKQYLFDEYACLVAAWLSPSRRGVKALVKIPIVDTVELFKEYFYGMAAELWNYQGFDPTTQNPVLDLFFSYDPEILHRDNPTQWTEKGINIRSIDNVKAAPPLPVKPCSEYERMIIKIIDSGFDKITDNGHPQLRSLCIAIGGYIANGYIDHTKALQHIDHQITTHHYLKKGIPGYKRTARQMLDYGQKRPLQLNAKT